MKRVLFPWAERNPARVPAATACDRTLWRRNVPRTRRDQRADLGRRRAATQRAGAIVTRLDATRRLIAALDRAEEGADSATKANAIFESLGAATANARAE